MDGQKLLELRERARTGDRVAVGRLMTAVTRSPLETAMELLDEEQRHKAIVVGITGPPGVGKSCLVSSLIGHARSLSLRVAAICVDPSSPFSGGAVLGDRLRIAQHNLDPEVYVRSFASRGKLGGTAAQVPAAVEVLASCGFDLILIETVGVGQNELAIASEAPITLLVLSPATGDSVQVMKSGVMEVADVIAFNKSDLPGAEAAKRELRSALLLASDKPPTLVETSTVQNQGIEELWQTLARLAESAPDHSPNFTASNRLLQAAVADAEERLSKSLSSPAGQELIDQLEAGELGEWQAIARLRKLSNA